MTTHDNADPLPDWRPAPHCWPQHGPRCDTCDICVRHERDGFGTYPLPTTIELGEN